MSVGRRTPNFYHQIFCGKDLSFKKFYQQYDYSLQNQYANKFIWYFYLAYKIYPRANNVSVGVLVYACVSVSVTAYGQDLRTITL
jgi:hypothetical protein